MNQNASSIVEWAGEHSDSFDVNQGVRQGGILSADLYKVHINSALERLQNSGAGFRIGDIFVAQLPAQMISQWEAKTLVLDKLCYQNHKNFQRLEDLSFSL